MEHTLGFLPQRAKLYQPGACKELTKKKKKKEKKPQWSQAELTVFANQGVQTFQGR